MALGGRKPHGWCASSAACGRGRQESKVWHPLGSGLLVRIRMHDLEEDDLRGETVLRPDGRSDRGIVMLQSWAV